MTSPAEKLFGTDLPQDPRPDDAHLAQLLVGALIVLPWSSMEDRRFWLDVLKRLGPVAPKGDEHLDLDMAVTGLRYWTERLSANTARHYDGAHLELVTALRGALKRAAGDLVKGLEQDGTLDTDSRVSRRPVEAA